MVSVHKLILWKSSSINHFSGKMLKSSVRRFIVKFKFQLNFISSELPSPEIFQPYQQERKANQTIHWNSTTQSAVCGPAASASPETLLEMQILSLHNRPPKLEPLGMEPNNVCFNHLSTWGLRTLKFVNHCTRLFKI